MSGCWESRRPPMRHELPRFPAVRGASRRCLSHRPVWRAGGRPPRRHTRRRAARPTRLTRAPADVREENAEGARKAELLARVYLMSPNPLPRLQILTRIVRYTQCGEAFAVRYAVGKEAMRAITLLLAILFLVGSGCASHPPSIGEAVRHEEPPANHGLTAADGSAERQPWIATRSPAAGDPSLATARPAVHRDLLRLPPVEVFGASSVDGRFEPHGTYPTAPSSRLIPTQWNADVFRLLPTQWDGRVVFTGHDEVR
jgi:hypothetical protein